MTRTRATPVSAQLRSWLSAPPDGTGSFSAVDLAAGFDRPRTEALKTAIASVNKALRKAHADGQVVCFVDERGSPLRVKKYVEPGSKSNEHPIIYGLPDTPSPENGYRPAAYNEVNRPSAHAEVVPNNGAVANDEPSTAGTPTDEPATSADDVDDDRNATLDAATDGERLAAITERIKTFVPVGPAPEWVPDAVLARLVALPAAQAHWRRGLSGKNSKDRVALVMAGVQPKRDFSAESGTAQALVALMRKEQAWFDRLLTCVCEHFNKKGGGIPEDQLVAFVDDPEGWALEHEKVPVEFLVANGILAGADESALADVADAFAIEPQERGPTVEERLRARTEELQGVKAELGRQLRETLRQAEKQEKVVTGLRKEVDELRAGHEQAEGSLQSLADRRASELTDSQERVAELEAELEAALEDAERAQADVRGTEELAGLQEELDAVRAAMSDERRLRQKADEREQEQAARARDLARQLVQASDARMQLPVENASDVLFALAGPVGQAARAASERMAKGTAQPDDFRVLELAASFGRLAARISEHASDAETVNTGAAELDGAAEMVDESVSVGGVAVTAAVPAGEEASTGTDVAAAPEPAATASSRPPTTAAAKAAQRRLPFTITPLGGAEEVGGSALVVETPDGTVLLDAGQRVRGEYGDPDLAQFHYSASGVDRLDAILISHAHIDHVGSLPVLAQEYDGPPIWMSEPTVDLARIMLKDSAKIQESRTNRQIEIAELAESDLSTEGVVRAAYELHDVDEVMDTVEVAPPDRPVSIPETDLIVRFQPVDHVLGACAIHLKHRGSGKTLLYTGDLGPFTDPQETLPGRNPIDTLTQADVVIMESTYGVQGAEAREGRRRLHAGREQARQLLKDTAEAAFGREGFILLPTFSLGRTQELLRILASREMPEAPIYVGGMGERITTLYADWASKRDGGQWVPPGRFASGVTSINRWLRSHPGMQSAASEVLADQEPGYLLVSPAMISGGWSRAFLELMVEDPRHAVAFTGYLPRHAGGIRNVDRVAKGRILDLPDRRVKVTCDWQVLKGLSAHAPSGDLRKFASGMTRGTRTAFGCVHGEPAAQQELAAWIETSVTGASGQSLSRNTPWVPSLTQ